MEDTCILIVDDDAGIRDTMHEFIGMSGYEAMAASSAEEALEILKTREADVVISDISLPGMSGNEAVAALRTNADFTDKPIIALSANAMKSDIQAGLDAGFDAYLTKPLDITLLMKELEKVFGEVVIEDD